MNVIVVGCGRLGSELAYRLYKRGHQVTVVDEVGAAFENLPADFRGRTVEGSALNEDVLRRAGIAQAQSLAAVTNSDSLNAVVAHLARTLYQPTHVVVRNYDPHWRSMHEAFGAQVVSSASWGAQRIEELLYQSEIRTVFSAGNGEVEIYELAVSPAWQGRQLQDLISSANPAPLRKRSPSMMVYSAGLHSGPCRAVALTRSGQAMLAEGDMLLEAGDLVLLSATLDGIEALRARLQEQREG